MVDFIYARQSVDKEDSISIESQIELCLREVGNNQHKVFRDKGYSGKNTERPDFQEMMAEVRAGGVGRIIVYRLDRISRSVLDFANVISELQKYGVEFVSITERFDTSTPIGKAMLMIVMVFAQLERETIQQRVIDAYRSRSRKGFYMGGRVPYGYELENIVMDGIKTCRGPADHSRGACMGCWVGAAWSATAARVLTFHKHTLLYYVRTRGKDVSRVRQRKRTQEAVASGSLQSLRF